MIRARAAAVVLIVGALASWGCSSNSGGSTRGTAVPAPKALRVGVVGLDSLDPARADQPVKVLVAALLYQSLVSLSPAMRPVPGVASRWTVDSAQKRFTFTLRRDARFDDGTRVTAADVKATLDRVAAKATASPLAALLADVVGYNAVHVDGSTGALAGITIPDDHTVVFDLASPSANFPSGLGHPALGIRPQHELTSPKPGALPIGSGPYKLGRARASPFTLQRVGRGGGPDRIELVGEASVTAAQHAVTTGRRLDATLLGSEKASGNSRSAHEIRAPALAVSYYAINLKSPKFVDARFREAIVRALDAAKLVHAASGDANRPATGIVSAGVPGMPADPCAKRCSTDLAAAKRLLGAAFPNGGIPVVAIDFDDSPAQQALAAAARLELASVGIVATPRAHPVAEYGNFLASGSQEVFRLGAVTDEPTPQPFLGQFASQAPDNVVGFAVPAFDSALTAAASDGDTRSRAQSYTLAERSVLDQYAVAPIVQYETRLLVARRVHGLGISPLGALDLRHVTVG
jgi:oligopeptide transport system substrate-binding protein